jgi:hypothetical protein
MASPAGLDHARELSPERKHTETDSAKLEVAVVAARPAAHFAAVAVPDGKLLGAIQLRKFFRSGHLASS